MFPLVSSVQLEHMTAALTGVLGASAFIIFKTITPLALTDNPLTNMESKAAEAI
jgi:hypothetical protein